MEGPRTTTTWWRRRASSSLRPAIKGGETRTVVASIAHRRALLSAALGFIHLDRSNEPKPPALTALARWMDSWPGLGAVAVGMAAQGYDLQFTEYSGENWRATFFVTGMAHSIVKGSVYEPTPWRAVQQAASEALNRV